MYKKMFALILLAATVLLLSGCFALEEPEEASGAVSAPTLAPAEEALAPAEAATAEPAPTAEAAVEMPVETEVAEAYPIAPEAPAPDTAADPTAYPADEVDTSGAPDSGGALLYEIDPARSEARFTINEVLRGTPTVVVGVSQNLGGQINLDLANPAAAQIGTILINARDFATDNEFRNRAIANEILLTNEHEFISFEPAAISGLPEAAEIGQSYELQITGDLTIIGQTREVTFAATVTPLSANELQGTAVVDILYADFGITIPFSRSVEAVEDNVKLELDFVAAAG